MTLEESMELERLKHTLQCELERQKSEYAQKVPAVAGAFSYASETIKTLVLLNGGAAIALLSFIGSNAPKYVDFGSGQTAKYISGIMSSLTYFLMGLGLAAFASACSYFSQLFFNENVLLDVSSNRSRAEWARVMAMAFALTSIVMFAFGSTSSVRSLSNLAVVQKASQ